MDHIAVDVREPDVASAKTEREPRMIDPEQVQDGCVEVVHLEAVFGGAVAPVVRGAVGDAGPDAASGHPDGKTVFVVIAAIGALGERGSTKFTGPEYEGVVQEAAAAQVSKETGDGLIDGAGVDAVVVGDVAVGIPAAVAIDHGDGEFDEPDAALDETTGEQALTCVGAGVRVGCVETVERLGGGGFSGQVEEFGDGGLHPAGEFRVGDGGFEGVVGSGRIQGEAVEAAGEAAFGGLESGHGFAGGDVGEGCAVGVEKRRLTRGGQETVAEAVDAPGRDLATIEDDEAGDVSVFGSEAVGDPCAHAGTALETEAGVEEIVGARVFRESGGHRAQDAEFVGAAGDVGEKITDPETALSVLTEPPWRTEHGTDVLELGFFELAHDLAGTAAVVLFEERFVIE